MKLSNIFLWTTAFTCLISDFCLKLYTYHFIPQMSWYQPDYPFGGVGVFSLGPISFSLNYIQNLGAAWGMFAGYSKVLVAFRILIILAMAIFLLFMNREKKRVFPLMLILTGAIGNVVDYFTYGFVVDMFHFRFWGYTPFIFNLADSLITFGIIGLCWQSWFKTKKIADASKTT